MEENGQTVGPGIALRIERIWKDFDKMILNEEWIEENLRASKPRLVTVQMLPQKVAYRRADGKST
jgi:hypothetical protein